MHFQVSSKDDVAFLTESSIQSSTRPGTQRSTGAGSTIITDPPDTIHFLSPVSTTARTEYEGDLDYQKFYFSPIFGHDIDYKPGIGTSTTESSISCEDETLQRTIAIVKPEALCYKDVVIHAIKQAGLKIINERTIHLTPEQVSEIYETHYGSIEFPHMVVSVSAAPILVLSLQAVNAVDKWKTMIGPLGTLHEEWFFPFSCRTRFGLVGDMENVLHASKGVNDAKKESRFFYPRHIQEPLPSDHDKVKDYISTFVRPALLSGLAEIVRTKPIDPVLSLAEWLLLNNPYQPRIPEKITLTQT